MTLTFDKTTGLIPAVVQDSITGSVLMLGYMNQEAVDETRRSGRVTFFSRSKQRLWTKGEESGNYLELVAMSADCDQDALLVKAIPHGPTCHKGTDTCWGEQNDDRYGFLNQLEGVIADRRENAPENSYVSSLFEKGINKIAQKVGEEAVELVIEAMDESEELFLNESADLLFHYLILLQAKGYTLSDVTNILRQRHR